MRRILILLTLLLSLFRSYSQKPEIQFDRISVQEGLSDHSINCITQDRTGFIWIGGLNGLYRYDGYDFVNYQYQPGDIRNQYFKDIYRIKEDRHGLLWIVSEIGIVLFDPEHGRSILLDIYMNERKSDVFNYRPDILTGSDDNILATHRNGLIRISFNSDLRKLMTEDNSIDIKDVIKTEIIDLPASNTGQSDLVTSIFEDRNKNILVGCISGLYSLDKAGGKLNRVSVLSEKAEEKSFEYVRSIAQEYDNSYWIAAGNFLYNLSEMNAVKGELQSDISLHVISKSALNNDEIPTSLLVDHSNNILLGTDKEFYKITKDKKNNRINLSLIATNENSPEYYGYTKTIRDIFEDRSGVIWTAQEYYGITRFNLNGYQFNSYKDLIIKNFTSSDINPLHKDRLGNLWIGTYGGGLYKMQENNFSISKYYMHLQKNNIVCMAEISPGLFWIGTDRGLVEFNSSTGKSGDPAPAALKSINQNETYIWDILKDNDLMFIGTGDGLYLFDLITENLTHYPLLKSESVSDRRNTVFSLLRRKNGEILSSTSLEGIFSIRYLEKGLEFTQIADNNTLAAKGINLMERHQLFEDSTGSIWIADNSGLHNLNTITSELTSYRLFDKVNFPIAWSVTEDNQGNLWIGTHFGLCCLNKASGRVKVYKKETGLPLAIHGFNSVFKDIDGKLYFGGIGGFYDFYPDSLKINNSIPPVVITDILLFNKSLKEENSKLEQLTNDVPFLGSIKIRHNQNDLSFKFSALDYYKSSENKYLYKLEGYQDEWIKTDAENRIASYLKLKPGTYTFKVRGSNSDGTWNEEGTSLQIVIRRPWWFTSFALAGYIIIIISAISGLFRWRLHVLKKEREELENQVVARTMEIQENSRKISEQKDQLERQNKTIQETEELKSRFFSNISHEFRTPLALIKGPAEELLDLSRLNEKERRKLRMINRNANRLLSLVNQLLDLSKLEGNKMILEICESDVMKHLYSIAESFTSMAEARSINFQFKTDKKELISYFDPDKIEKIATNILSNAFKFTPAGGEIDFSASYHYDETTEKPLSLEFTVKDNGPGIPEKSLEKIFDRFYQAEETMGTENIGTGLGLTLSLELARLMHGDIKVMSRPKSGTAFTVIIPLGKGHLQESEYLEIRDVPDSISVNKDPLKGYLNTDSDEREQGNEEKGKPVILIVDDNRDMRNHLVDNLDSLYSVRTAVDGIAGLKKAVETIPDLIVTDLMMPKMDGIEFCRLLKENEVTCHIPVIMLTARDTLDDKLTGLQTGADDYIPKPFIMPELKARIANLINQRLHLRERFGREITLQPGKVTVTSADEKFLNKAMSVIEERMKDEEFILDEFQKAMNLSRSTLFRKIAALTGQSPTEFIRTIRLKRAAELIRQNFGNISEVSGEVGFNNISYFNRSFKKLYGVSPREFAMKEKNENL